MDEKRIVRFLLTFFLGWIGSIVINHSSLKPAGFTSKTVSGYILLNIVTFGIYGIVASICNISFDGTKLKNIGYKRDRTMDVASAVKKAASDFEAGNL